MESLVQKTLNVFINLTNSNSKKAVLLIGAGYLIYLVRQKNKKIASEIQVDPAILNKKKKGNVDLEFLQKVYCLIKIAIPKAFGRETFNILILTALLVLRTFLSIWISDINGSTVRAIVNRSLPNFIKQLIILGLYSFPSAVVNSGLDYFIKKIGLYLRENLTHHFHKQYLNDMCFYQITNLDTRIANPDQIFGTDIDKWAHSLANLYNNFSKPILDLVLFIRKLSQTMGYSGPFIMLTWYSFCAVFIKFITPPFGKLIAIEQNLEGQFRANHASIVNNSEEIAFYRGNQWELARLSGNFKNLIDHISSVLYKKLFMGTYDSILTKYGAVLGGYAILGMPVFTGSERYTKKFQNDSSIITKDYIRNNGLLVNLAKAIGRLIYSYKDLQNLAGYTHSVDQLRLVMDDIKNEKFVRPQVNNEVLSKYVGGAVSVIYIFIFII